ncbi:MAG: RsmB/NOP family class I SAM-dependent RNA methyltransferase [Acidimicrobiia bacterium]|nr:RsmB/NOP family class I SAM-dependent RNA methyltransferase [Acidimicrobiia bacterium]
MTDTLDRSTAAKALGRVLRQGAWSNVVARVEARQAGADPSNTQALVYAVLRALPHFDQAIEAAAHRPVDSIEPPVLDLMRVGLAESAGGRTPIPLIVDSIVHAVRQESPRAAGFANAVLRRATHDVGEIDQIEQIGVPLFVDEALRHVLDPVQVDALWWASQEPAAVGLRSDTPIPGAVDVPGIPDAWLWTAGRPPDGVAVQDPASVAVGNAVGAEDEDRVLDCAAAPGGKTAHLASRTRTPVVALDRSRRRVEDAARRVPDASWVVGDGRRLPFGESTFDRVLVDAPCTGLGTLRRRPEIRYRVTPADTARLAAIQRAMLAEAIRVARPGGRVVYSVCTFTPAETIDVVAGLGGRAPEGLAGTPFGDGWLLAPHLGPTDGMFICVFDR